MIDLSKQIQLTIVLLLLASILYFNNIAYSAKIQSGVIISPPLVGTCDLKVISAVPIDYGQLTAQKDPIISAQKEVTYNNTGNSNATIRIAIFPWLVYIPQLSSVNHSLSNSLNWTRYSTTPDVEYKDKNKFSILPTEPPTIYAALGQLAPGKIGRVFLQAQLPGYYLPSPGGAPQTVHLYQIINVTPHC